MASGQHLITPEPAHPPTPKTNQALGIVLLLAALFVGGGWVLEAFTWLVVGPEAGYTGCNCWAAHYNDWQYVAQFFISVAGAVGLVVTAIAYLVRWRWAVLVSAAASTALGCAWLAFLATS